MVFHRRFVGALELALSLHNFMAGEVPTAFGKTSSQHSSHTPANPSQYTAQHTAQAQSAVHTSGHATIVTKDLQLTAARRDRPRSASSALHCQTATVTPTHGHSHNQTVTNMSTAANTSLAGMIEGQLGRGDLLAAAAATVTPTATVAPANTIRPIGALSLTHSQSGGLCALVPPPPAPHSTPQLNSSGAQACLACNRPLRDQPRRAQPALSTMPLLLSSFEQEMALLSSQDRVVKHSALAAGGIVAAVAVRSSAALQATQEGWSQSQHHPAHQYPHTPGNSSGVVIGSGSASRLNRPRSRPSSASTDVGEGQGEGQGQGEEKTATPGRDNTPTEQGLGQGHGECTDGTTAANDYATATSTTTEEGALRPSSVLRRSVSFGAVLDLAASGGATGTGDGAGEV